MIQTVAETGSTNADLLSRLSAGESISEGYWLRAEQQSTGRGRSGREWLSRPGNLYTSTVVNLRADDPPAHTLSLVVGLAAWEVLNNHLKDGAHLRLKWPNDILVGQAKIAGILLERTGDYVVAGIGINVRFAPDIAGREITCIHDVNRTNMAGPEHILLDLTEQLTAALKIWRGEGLSNVIRQWNARAFPNGTAISVHIDENERLSGEFAGLDETGSLILRLADGAMRTIHAGDVSLLSEKD